MRTRFIGCLVILVASAVATQWASEQTAYGPAFTAHTRAAPTHRQRPLFRHRAHETHAVVNVARATPRPLSTMPTQVELAASPLLPISMPAQQVAYATLRGHLDGQVVVQLQVDAAGRVLAASLARSSGDAVLDAHALATVHGWRFAVPADHPEGLRGQLTMRFASAAEPR